MRENEEKEATDSAASEVCPFREDRVKLDPNSGINDLSIGFDDDGIANRAMEIFAEEKNISTDAPEATPELLSLGIKAQSARGLSRWPTQPRVSGSRDRPAEGFRLCPSAAHLPLRPRLPKAIWRWLQPFAAGSSIPATRRCRNVPARGSWPDACRKPARR